MKYVISAIIYILLFSVFSGFVDVLFGYRFVDGFFPTEGGAWARWTIRFVFSIYLTVNNPLGFFK